MRHRSGFTLLELIMVIAVIAILATILVPKITSLIQKTKTSQCLANRTIIEEAETRYRIEHNNTPSDSLDQLRQAGYLDRIPVCNSGGTYVWISTALPVQMGCSYHYWPAPAP